MSDLGTKALLDDDLDAKVTTNAPAKENTGLRVRTFLHNLIDTLYALIGRDIAPTATFSTNTNTAQDPGQDTVRFNSGTIGSVTELALSDVVGGVDKGDLNSRFSGIIQFRPVGTTETIEFQITDTPFHTTWTRYTVTYLKGSLPANGTVMAVRFLPVNVVTQTITSGEKTTSPSEDAVFDALAGKADAVAIYQAIISQSGTDDPTVVVVVNTLGVTVTWTRNSAGYYTGTYSATLSQTNIGATVGVAASDSSIALPLGYATSNQAACMIETISQVIGGLSEPTDYILSSSLLTIIAK